MCILTYHKILDKLDDNNFQLVEIQLVFNYFRYDDFFILSFIAISIPLPLGAMT